MHYVQVSRTQHSCSFVLQEVIELYERNDSSLLYLLFLDASQAFDPVKYCKLIETLFKKYVCNCTVRLLINMYTTQCLRVKWAMEFQVH